MSNITYIVNTREKDQYLVLKKETLSKLSKGKIKGLVAKIFNNDLYWIPNDSHTTILNEEVYAPIAELLYIVSGISLYKYKSFINSLIPLKEINPTSPIPYGVAMLEPTKEKILQIIKSSKILSILAHNPSELLSYKDEDIVTVKDLALKRFCFLVANNEKLRISEGLEAELLLSETNNEKLRISEGLEAELLLSETNNKKLETSEGLEAEVLLSDEISESSVEVLLSEANNEKLEISKDSETATLLLEAEALLKIISFNNSNYDIYDNLKKYLVEECETYENFKKILGSFSDKIREIIKFDDKLVSKLLDWGKNFEDNVDLLTNEIEKLLNLNLENILPKNVFLRSVDNKKEEEINENDKKFLEDNLKFFTTPSIFAVLGYGPFNENEYNSSLTYYQNNPKSLIPNLVLLKTTHDGAKISKLKDILNNHYLKAKSTVGNCLNVILKYHECYKSLETINLSTDVIKQDLLDKLPGLTDKIEIVLNSPEVENVKNITLLCKEVKDFLNISPITSVFEEYDNNYQALKYDIDKAEEILGEIGIEWSFS